MCKLVFLLALFLLCSPHARGETVTASSGIPSAELLFDMDLETTQRCEAEASLTLEGRIGALYLVFDRPYGTLLLTDEETGTVAAAPTGGMLHVFLDMQEHLGTAPHRLTISFPAGEALLNELRAFPPGEVPGWVQRWERIPEGKADLLLLSTHGDDEQLFFAGLLPWYAGEKGLRVQVVYFTDHRNLTAHRVHEMLDGLWAVGVRDYPVFGHFDDYYTFDLEDAYRYYEEKGYPRQALLAFVTEQLRRYCPLVAVGHDPAGEYGHGMHQLTADLLKEAVMLSGDADAFPEQLDRYAPWQVPKTYLHLYPENSITMDWDIPLEAFHGMTAYEVTKELGFPCHASQVSDFAWYFRGADRATEVTKYSPCRYGLYHSTVGEDTGIGDFFEHLTPREETPPVTQPPAEAPKATESQPSPTSPPEPVPNAQKSWIFIPAAGALLLTLLTACLNARDPKEKF